MPCSMFGDILVALVREDLTVMDAENSQYFLFGWQPRAVAGTELGLCNGRVFRPSLDM
jgi:hypothetical protein